jgi:hypothetical protein
MDHRFSTDELNKPVSFQLGKKLIDRFDRLSGAMPTLAI